MCMRVYLLLLLFLISFELRSAVVNVSDFHDIEPILAELTQRHEPKDILVVLDYDHTIAQALGVGGEAWFRWQHSLLDQPERRPRLISSILDILYLQAFLLENHLSELVQPEKPQILARMQSRGVRSIVITARTPIFRDVTLADLSRFGIGFESSAIPPGRGYPLNYLPYTNNDIESYGLPADAVERYQLFKEPRPVRYESGVMFSCGQNKGAILRTLLKKTGTSPKAIVFVDDSLHHITKMEDAFSDTPIELVSVHYTRSRADTYVAGADKLEEWKREFDRMLPYLENRMKDLSCFDWLGELAHTQETAY